MRIVEIYSHLNGYEWLHHHKKELWTEIEGAITSVDAEACRTKVSKEKRMEGKVLYSPIDMNAAIKKNLESCEWSESRVSYWVTENAKLISQTMNMPSDKQKEVLESAGAQPIYSYNQTDFVKNRVAIEVQFGKYPFVAFDMFVKHLAFYVGDKIDLGIEIVPMKALQAEMSSGPSYYEGELYNLVRQGRGVPNVPLVLIGIAP